MTRIDIYKIAVIGLLALNLGTLVFLFTRNSPQAGPPPTDREGPKQLIIQRLHLDKDQISEYDRLVDDHRSQMRSLEDSVQQARDQLYSRLRTADTTVNADQYLNLLRITTSMEALNYRHFQAIRSLCKPDQISDFNELTKDLGRLFNGRPGPPPHR